MHVGGIFTISIPKAKTDGRQNYKLSCARANTGEGRQS